MPEIVHPLSDTFFRAGFRGQVQQSLITRGVLKNGFGSAVDGEHHRLFAALEPSNQLGGIPAERRERLDMPSCRG